MLAWILNLGVAAGGASAPAERVVEVAARPGLVVGAVDRSPEIAGRPALKPGGGGRIIPVAPGNRTQ